VLLAGPADYAARLWHRRLFSEPDNDEADDDE
jgi:hypothetical protein